MSVPRPGIDRSARRWRCPRPVGSPSRRRGADTSRWQMPKNDKFAKTTFFQPHSASSVTRCRVECRDFPTTVCALEPARSSCRRHADAAISAMFIPAVAVVLRDDRRPWRTSSTADSVGAPEIGISRPLTREPPDRSDGPRSRGNFNTDTRKHLSVFDTDLEVGIYEAAARTDIGFASSYNEHSLREAESRPIRKFIGRPLPPITSAVSTHNYRTTTGTVP